MYDNQWRCNNKWQHQRHWNTGNLPLHHPQSLSAGILNWKTQGYAYATQKTPTEWFHNSNTSNPTVTSNQKRLSQIAHYSFLLLFVSSIKIQTLFRWFFFKDFSLKTTWTHSDLNNQKQIPATTKKGYIKITCSKFNPLQSNSSKQS